MANKTTGAARIGFGLTFTGDADFGSQKALLPFPADIPIGNGIGAGQVDIPFWDKRTLAASTSEDIDLAGVLIDLFGDAITFVKVNGIYVKAAAANTGNIIIGGAAVNAFVGPFGDATDKHVLGADNVFMALNLSAAGWAVTAGTADLLKIDNDDAGATADYEIAIIGRSA